MHTATDVRYSPSTAARLFRLVLPGEVTTSMKASHRLHEKSLTCPAVSDSVNGQLTVDLYPEKRTRMSARGASQKWRRVVSGCACQVSLIACARIGEAGKMNIRETEIAKFRDQAALENLVAGMLDEFCFQAACDGEDGVQTYRSETRPNRTCGGHT
jgi:hypothetical protein